jgi:hypothetical protein
MRALIATAAVVTVVGPAALCAQSTRTSAAPATSRTEVTLFGGGGGVLPGSQPGFDRGAGTAVVAGVELARPALPGLIGRVALRAEGGFAAQDLALPADVADGDVHTPHAALAARVSLLGRHGGPRRLLPYLVLGGTWARPSTRLALREDPRATPGARFEQVTHENVAGILAGGGLAWQARRVAVRAEARWLSLATHGSATTLVPVLLTVAVPLHR